MPRKKKTLKQINDVARKTLRRRIGDVKRYEIVLVADSPRDQYIADWMGDNLKRGAASEFMRRAIEEKIARELLDQSADTPQAIVASEQVIMLYQEIRDERQRASEQFEALIREIHDLRQVLQSVNIEATRVTETVRVYQEPPPTLPEVGTVPSSGLDMSRPRPRAKPTVLDAPKVEQVPDVLSEEDQVRLAKIFMNSVYRAQPGKGG